MKRLLPGLCLLCITVSAQAEPAPELAKAAEELTTVMGLNKSQVSPMQPLVDGMAKRMNLNEADTAEFRSIYDAWFTQDLDQSKIRKEVTQIYADSFTLDEIKQITVFYQSPVGQKMLATNPVLAQKSSQIGMEEARSKQHLLQQRLAPFLAKHGIAPPGGGQGAPLPGAAPAPVPAPAPKQ